MKKPPVIPPADAALTLVINEDGLPAALKSGACGLSSLFGDLAAEVLGAAASSPQEARLDLAALSARVALAELVVGLQAWLGGTIRNFLDFAELDRNTHRKLISAALRPKGDQGTMLESLSPMLRKSGAALVLTLHSDVPGQATMVFQFRGENGREFCANYFRQCRAVAGLSKKQLDEQLGKKGNGYTSKVETGTNKKGVSITALLSTAIACGFNPTIAGTLPRRAATRSPLPLQL